MTSSLYSGKLLVSRKEANALLHLTEHASYELLPKSLVEGKVRMSDIREAVNASARNGAKWEGGNLVRITGKLLGISERSLHYYLKRSSAPHFRVNKYVVLVEEERINEFIKGKNEHSKTKKASYGN